jgi:ATP-dependent RNA helicase SUPV3L1/SUV3
LRWTGAPVGKLVAGEEVLRPRVRVVADEHLTGAPRDAVEARLDAFVKSHIEKLLGPLSQLAAAADVSGIARGIAYQLVEALGVLDRQRVADEVKGLDQPARATLRKYGVRFGAYHIYLPNLLKPAPRTLAAQLWALKNEGTPIKGIDDLLHLAGSGRTSIPVDREIDAGLYRTAGYRACGERAVRVDILERLADLIRPALAWREGAPGSKPPGAVVGGGFTVVNGMTSLTGASGEDFASILRSLGYRMDRRPKPAEPPPAAEVAPAELVPEAAITLTPVEATESGSDASATEAVPVADAAPVAEVAEAVVSAGEPEPVVVSAVASEPQGEPLGESLAAAAPADAGEEVKADAPVEPQIEPSEPILIEVWMPGRAVRPEGARRRPRHRREPRKDGAPATPQPQNGDATPALAASDAAAQPSAPQTPDGAPSREGGHFRHRRRQGGDQRHGNDRNAGDRHGGERHGGDQRQDRPPRDRDRQHVKRFERRERDKAPDPNSPFAKLAALKAQLEADSKERR